MQYSDYISSLIQTEIVLECWNVSYRIFVHPSMDNDEQVLDAVEKFEMTDYAAKTLYILEQLGCGTVCIFDGRKLSFCMTDVDLYKQRISGYRFDYRAFQKWLNKKIPK